MLKKRDNIHFYKRTIDGFNKPFNMIPSARDAGKSTVVACDEVYANYKKGYCTILLRRQTNDMTTTFIDGIKETINEYSDENFNWHYSQDERKSGICPIYVGDKLCCVVIALSVKMYRIKTTRLSRPPKSIVFDEFILNPKYKEKYLVNEYNRFREVYDTFWRYNNKLKAYLFGNPYTLYNPYYVGFGVDIKKLKVGVILSGKNWVIQNYKLHPDLVAILKATNPLYEEDGEYAEYALKGEAVNDRNIRTGTIKNGYTLYVVFYLDNKYLGVYYNSSFTIDGDEPRFFIKEVSADSNARNVYAFDISDLIGRNVLYGKNEKEKMRLLDAAYRKNQIEYENINVYYLFKEVYFNL